MLSKCSRRPCLRSGSDTQSCTRTCSRPPDRSSGRYNRPSDRCCLRTLRSQDHLFGLHLSGGITWRPAGKADSRIHVWARHAVADGDIARAVHPDTRHPSPLRIGAEGSLLKDRGSGRKTSDFVPSNGRAVHHGSQPAAAPAIRYTKPLNLRLTVWTASMRTIRQIDAGSARFGFEELPEEVSL